MSTTFLKKYKVLGKVGEGSFSEVLKCQNRETGVFYAAKRLKKMKESITDVLQTPEVVAMRKLKEHPNILHMIESHFDPLPGKVTLIFELMDMSMYDLLKPRKRCLPEVRVKNYLYQILKGLDHLHRHGLFHRDIKPENILLKNDVVKLADLGSVRGIFCRPPYTEYISTRWYRSPECLLTTGFYGPKMDVWATGCVFYELLTLKPLFPGSNEVDQLTKIHVILGTPNQRLISKFRRHKSRNCEYFFPSRTGSGICPMLPNVSEAGRDILKHMLVYDPDTRSNVRRLLEHRYFNDLREEEMLSPRRRSWSVAPSSQTCSEWRNPALLSYMMSFEKRRKHKRASGNRRASENKTLPRVVVSSPSGKRTPLQAQPSRNVCPTVNKQVAAKQKLLERTWGVSSITKNTPVCRPKLKQGELQHGEVLHLPHLPRKPSCTNKEEPFRSTSTLPILQLPPGNKKNFASNSFVHLPPLVKKSDPGSPSKRYAFISDLMSQSDVVPRRAGPECNRLATIEEQPLSKMTAMHKISPSVQSQFGGKTIAQGKLTGRPALNRKYVR